MKKKPLDIPAFSLNELASEIHEKSHDNIKINSISPGAEIPKIPVDSGSTEGPDPPNRAPTRGAFPMQKSINTKQFLYAFSILIIGVIAGFEGKGVLDRFNSRSAKQESKKNQFQKTKKTTSPKNPVPETPAVNESPQMSVSQPQKTGVDITDRAVKPPLPESADNSPKLKFFNGFRTRTFWSIGKLNTSKEHFSVAFRIENLSQPVSDLLFPWKPFINWESKGGGVNISKGTIPIASFNPVQVIKIPLEAWQSGDIEEVLLELSLGWQQVKSSESDSEKPPQIISSEKAVVRLRSLTSILAQNPKSPHLVSMTAKPSPYHNPVKLGFWLTSWGKLSPDSSIQLLFPPETSPELIGETLRLGTDFSIAAQVQPMSETTWDEVWISGGNIALSLNKNGTENNQLMTALNQILSKKYKSPIKFKGPAEAFLCDLNQSGTNAGCLEKNIQVDQVFLYTPKRESPFIQIKKKVLNIPAARDMLVKEGHLLFLSPVTMISMGNQGGVQVGSQDSN